MNPETLRRIHATLLTNARAICAKDEHAPMAFGIAPQDITPERITFSTIIQPASFNDVGDKNVVAEVLRAMVRVYGCAVFISEGWTVAPTKWEQSAHRSITPPSERADRVEALLLTILCADGSKAMAVHPIHTGPPRTVEDAKLHIEGEENFHLGGRFGTI